MTLFAGFKRLFAAVGVLFVWKGAAKGPCRDNKPFNEPSRHGSAHPLECSFVRSSAEVCTALAIPGGRVVLATEQPELRLHAPAHSLRVACASPMNGMLMPACCRALWM